MNTGSPQQSAASGARARPEATVRAARNRMIRIRMRFLLSGCRLEQNSMKMIRRLAGSPGGRTGVHHHDAEGDGVGESAEVAHADFIAS